MGAFLKGPNKTTFGLHCDTLLPPPLPPQALVCNATYVLTEFNRENGSTAFVPGSHKFCRGPRPHEAKIGEGGNPDAIAVEAPPGSMIVWHGNTWHGAFNRRAPGLRVSMPVLMARPYMRTEEDLFRRAPEEVLARNSARFAYLVQQGIFYGFHSDESAEARNAHAVRHVADYQKESGGVLSLDPAAVSSVRVERVGKPDRRRGVRRYAAGRGSVRGFVDQNNPSSRRSRKDCLNASMMVPTSSGVCAADRNARCTPGMMTSWPSRCR